MSDLKFYTENVITFLYVCVEGGAVKEYLSVMNPLVKTVMSSHLFLEKMWLNGVDVLWKEERCFPKPWRTLLKLTS